MSRQPADNAATGETPRPFRDLGAGALMLCVAGFYGWTASAIPTSRLDDAVGAAGAPLALSVVLAALALVLMARSAVRILAARAENARLGGPEADPPGLAWSRHLRALGLLTFGAGYILLLPVVGYAVSIFCLLLAVAIYSGARVGVRTAFFAVTAGGLAYAIFVAALGIPLPAGMLLPG